MKVRWILKSRAENLASQSGIVSSHDRPKPIRCAALTPFHDDLFPHRREALFPSLQCGILSPTSLFHVCFTTVTISFLPHPHASRTQQNINNRDPRRIDNIKDDAHRNIPPPQPDTHTYTQHTDGENIHEQTPASPRKLLLYKFVLTKLTPRTPHQQTCLLPQTLSPLLKHRHTPFSFILLR
jgi:hypothetical protein